MALTSVLPAQLPFTLAGSALRHDRDVEVGFGAPYNDWQFSAPYDQWSMSAPSTKV